MAVITDRLEDHPDGILTPTGAEKGASWHLRYGEVNSAS